MDVDLKVSSAASILFPSRTPISPPASLQPQSCSKKQTFMSGFILPNECVKISKMLLAGENSMFKATPLPL